MIFLSSFITAWYDSEVVMKPWSQDQGANRQKDAYFASLYIYIGFRFIKVDSANISKRAIIIILYAVCLLIKQQPEQAVIYKLNEAC